MTCLSSPPPSFLSQHERPGGHTMQPFFQRCVQQVFFGVLHDAALRAMVAEVELDPTSATVARNIAKKVAPCGPAHGVGVQREITNFKA